MQQQPQLRALALLSVFAPCSFLLLLCVRFVLQSWLSPLACSSWISRLCRSRCRPIRKVSDKANRRSETVFTEHCAHSPAVRVRCFTVLPELPVFVEYSSLQKQLQSDIDLTAAVDSRFHAYAKAWWHDFNCIRPLHQTRLIQIFGLSEERKQRCVCTFVSPLRADRCLDSPLHAARFVRLI